MQFDEYESLVNIAKNNNMPIPHGHIANFYFTLLSHTLQDNTEVNQLNQKRACLEALWYEQQRPFYKVWPSIMPYLIKTKLSLTVKDLNLHRQAFAILLPKGNGTILVYTNPEILAVGVQLPDLSFGISIITGIDTVIETAIEEHPQYTPKLRLAIAILLLEHDPSIIEPEVLSKDRLKWEETKDLKYVTKAIRRGITGWRVGEKVEVIPHFRKPHFAIRWTGKGSTIPKLTAIKGSIVHREIVEQVPTGYLDT